MRKPSVHSRLHALCHTQREKIKVELKKASRPVRVSEKNKGSNSIRTLHRPGKRKMRLEKNRLALFVDFHILLIVIHFLHRALST